MLRRACRARLVCRSTSSSVHFRCFASSKHSVTLEKDTLYVDEGVARGLGWEPGQPLDGVELTLHGWEKGYFVITRKGTDAGIIYQMCFSIWSQLRRRTTCDGNYRKFKEPYRSRRAGGLEGQITVCLSVSLSYLRFSF